MGFTSYGQIRGDRKMSDKVSATIIIILLWIDCMFFKDFHMEIAESVSVIMYSLLYIGDKL